MDHASARDAQIRAATDAALETWLARLAQPHGAPGGGAAAGLFVAIGAALLQMVAGYSDDDRVHATADALAAARVEALEAAEGDALVSAALGAALALPGEDRDREREVVATSRAAITSSLRLGAVGAGLVEPLEIIAEHGNPSVLADVIVAAEALAAGLGAAWTNASSNLLVLRRHLDAGGSEAVEFAASSAAERDELAAVRARVDDLRVRLADRCRPDHDESEPADSVTPASTAASSRTSERSTAMAKPSQAEGEDPDRPDTGWVQPVEGHPSQAEGEDWDDDENEGDS